MKTIRTSRGTAIPLDNDLLAVIEALYHDVTVQLDLDRSFDDMMKEIRGLVDQMTDAERAEYLVESLFLNTVTYENERLGALIRKLPERVGRAVSLNFQATRFRCSWPWETAVMLCDGRVVCGCADPYAKRVLGDARDDLGRRDLDRRDRVRRCAATSTPADPPSAATARSSCRWRTTKPRRCGRSTSAPAASRRSPPPLRRDHGGLQHLVPRRLLRARDRHHQDAPGRHARRRRCSSASSTSSGRRWPASTSSTTAKPSCTRRRSRCASWSRARYPHIYLYTSTNGGAFTEERVRQLVRSGIDEMTFSLDGASQDVYVRYRQRGSFEKSTAMMRAAIDEKRRLGRDVPVINWRYILFNWNDNDREMARARRLAAEWGVDRLCWEITDHPEHAYSRRFAPGTPEHAAHPPRDLGRQQPRATRSPARCRGRGSRCARSAGPMRRSSSRAGRDDPHRHARPQPVAAALPRHRDLRPPPRPPRRAARAPPTARRSTATGRAPSCRTRIDGGQRADVAIDVPVPREPGRYALRFDLVSEGIDWFETCGSEPTVRELVVAIAPHEHIRRDACRLLPLPFILGAMGGQRPRPGHRRRSRRGLRPGRRALPGSPPSARAVGPRGARPRRSSPRA